MNPILRALCSFFHSEKTTSGTDLSSEPQHLHKEQRNMTNLEKYIEEGWKSTSGWGIDDDLINIFRKINEFQTLEDITGPLCEIGVHHGRTLILLGLFSKNNEAVVGFDLFDEFQHQNIDSSGCGAYGAVLKNISIHAPNVDFTLVKTNSFDIIHEHMGKIRDCRFFHIDGGHFMEVVLNDLYLAQQSLNPGGVIVIDDYWHSGFPEVQEAVHRYFLTSQTLKGIPFAVGRNKIFLIGCAYHKKILEFCRQWLPANKQKTVRVHGYEALCVDAH